MMEHPALRTILRTTPASRLSLAGFDASATHGWDKDGARTKLARDIDRLTSLQDRLWAEQRHAVLVVLQGLDAAGKGGTVKRVVGAMNPAGVPVTSFKVPTEHERARDYLWRVHHRVPATGEVAVFDRSHYEDVLVVRVHGLVPEARWSRRYDHINAFERLLADEGTTIVKFLLWISPEEQAQRLRARHEDPTKRWKFRVGDLDERQRWHDYVAAFEDVLARCSTDWAPWYVIPADRKWFRNLAVAEILADTIESLDPRYPEPADLPAEVVIP